MTYWRRNFASGIRRSRSIDQSRCSEGVGLARIARARSRSCRRRVRASLSGTPLTLPLGCAEWAPPSPVTGEGLSIRNLPRLARLIERDEGEFALRHHRLALPVPLPRQRLGLEAQRGAALFQELDIDAELVADRHGAGEADRV